MTQNPGEAGIEGVTVYLLDDDGDPITATTDDNGDYNFDDVPVGSYRVRSEAPDGSDFTYQNAGWDDSKDSDVNADGVSDVFCVTACKTTKDIDAGIKACADEPADTAITGRYFCDKDGNALDNGEPGVGGRAVTLLQAGDDGLFGTDDDLTVATTETADDGSYSFTGLDAGEYAVKIGGAGFVTQDVDGNASDDIDSDVDADGMTGPISVAEGETVADVDAGAACYDLPEEGLLGVLGLQAGNVPPLITFNNTGVTNYDAASDSFTVNGAVQSFVSAAPVTVTSFPTTGSLQIDIDADETGALQGGDAFDFVVFDDLNNDDVVDAGEEIYLQGQVLAFGSDGSGAQTDAYDVIAELSGGTLADGFDPLIGVTWTSENSDFADDFTVDFAGQAKGSISDIGIDCLCY